MRTLSFGAFCCLLFSGLAGCTSGTKGEKGRAVFEFRQSSFDVSEASKKAFSTDTKSYLKVRSSDKSSPLPPWDIKSSDDGVVSIEDVRENEEYAIVLAMKAAGSADLMLVAPEDGKTIDSITLSVKAPEGLGLWLSRAFDLDEAPGTVVLPAEGDACFLNFYPYDKFENGTRMLLGEYEIAFDTTTDLFEFERIGMSGILVHEFYALTVSADKEGSETVKFTGPGEKEVTRTFKGIASSRITSIEIKDWAEGDEELKAKHVGDNGYIQAVQSASEEMLYVGFPATFESDNPAVVAVSDGLFSDNALFDFIAVGTATVTAALKDNPDIKATITFNVEEAPADEDDFD